jgi:hypothetical protein
MSNSDQVLRGIWEEIEKNNRYNREEQERWRESLGKQQRELEEWRTKREDAETENGRLREEIIKLRTEGEIETLNFKEQIEELKNINNGHTK